MANSFGFNNSWKIEHAKLVSLQSRISWADELKRPLIELEIDDQQEKVDVAVLTLDDNIDRLFKACEYVGVERIWLGQGEIVGCDYDHSMDGRCLIWEVRDLITVGCKELCAGCGNADQYQLHNLDSFIPTKYINRAWDVKTRTHIPNEPFLQRMVVSRGFSDPDKKSPVTATC